MQHGLMAVSYEVKGIKCDNPKCDYIDMEVEFDPEKYLNMPCPKCGDSLFTPEDYNAMKNIMAVTKAMNEVYGTNDTPLDAVAETYVADIGMNGTGKIKFGELKPYKEENNGN